MAWQEYTLVFRLMSPLHIGYRQTGNLQQTRGYVPGKNLWAALTARLTRDFDDGADGQRYQAIGEAVKNSFRFGYLYPALPRNVRQDIQSAVDLEIHYPWEDSLFDYRFLSSYTSAALNYDRQAAAEGLLHETEFIRPWTQPSSDDDKPLPVYLVGPFYVQENLSDVLTGWRAALERIQIGGERGYGWGRLRLTPLGEGRFCEEPVVMCKKDDHVLAHVWAEGCGSVVGPVEPLVGWERDNTGDGVRNWRLSSPMVCYAPGAEVTADSAFAIGHYGVWEPVLNRT